MHEFYDESGFQITLFRRKIWRLIQESALHDSIARDFLNPFGFEFTDPNEVIIKNDLKRFYIYLRSPEGLSKNEKIAFFNRFQALLQNHFPEFFDKVSVFVLENSKIAINKRAEIFNKYGNKSKLVVINFINTKRKLIEYYSDYVIATLPGFAMGKTVEFTRFEISFTRNLRAIQLYIMLETLFGKFVSTSPCDLLKEIKRSYPSNHVTSYFTDSPPLYSSEMKELIRARLMEIYEQLSQGAPLIHRKVQDINEIDKLSFQMQELVYSQTKELIRASYYAYGRGKQNG